MRDAENGGLRDFAGMTEEAWNAEAGAAGLPEDDARRAALELTAMLPAVMKELMKDIFRDNLYSFKEFMILPLVKREPGMTMGYYSERLFMSKPNFSQLVDKMVNNGYLERKAQERDRRTITLEVTRKGEEKAMELRAPQSRRLQERFSEYSAEDVQSLRQSVATINAIIRKYHH